MDVGIGNPLIKHLQREGIAVDMEGVIVEARPCALTVSPRLCRNDTTQRVHTGAQYADIVGSRCRQHTNK